MLQSSLCRVKVKVNKNILQVSTEATLEKVKLIINAMTREILEHSQNELQICTDCQILT